MLFSCLDEVLAFGRAQQLRHTQHTVLHQQVGLGAQPGLEELLSARSGGTVLDHTRRVTSAATTRERYPLGRRLVLLHMRWHCEAGQGDTASSHDGTVDISRSGHRELPATDF